MKEALLLMAFALWGSSALADSRCTGIDHSTLKGTLIEYSEGEGRHVYVTQAWYSMNLRSKQNIAACLATCKSAGGWVRIYDAGTGKELGNTDRWAIRTTRNEGLLCLKA